MRTNKPPCDTCQNLSPNHLPNARWQFNVADNLLIECSLEFEFSALEASCEVCSVIKNGLEALSRDVLRDHLEGLGERKGCLIVRKDAPLEVEVCRDAKGKASVRVQFFMREGNSNSDWDFLGAAREIAPLVSSKSHTSMIKSWITKCVQDHATCCHSPCGYSSGSILPTRLLDIRPRPDSSVILIDTKVLPQARYVPTYATVSHCWGAAHFIRTTLSNISSFKSGIPFDNLPCTFRDAISVTRELEIKYIWIDSLCIIQDSPSDWKHESALMASVYSNSYLNIAATGSPDSSHPFLTTRIAHNSPITITTEDSTEILVRPSMYETHNLFSTPGKNINWRTHKEENTQAPLLSRAWVFQERHLAPRTLHFYPSELVMECRSGLRCECTVLDSFTSNPLRKFEDMSFNSWFELVEDFSRLKLTYPSDRLSALMGVSKVFEEKLGCEYLSGIWEGDVTKGLLWNVSRYDSPGKETIRQGKEVAPSWSWASMVLSEGNRIFFPAGDNDSFVSESRFELLGIASSADNNALFVHSAFIDAIGCVEGEIEGEYEVLLIFEQDVDDFVLISTLPMDLDVSVDSGTPLEELLEHVSCVCVGSLVENDWKSNNDAKYLCMLIVCQSCDAQDSWKRIGVLNIKEELVLDKTMREGRFRLV